MKKEEALKTHADAMKTADEALYDAGMQEGTSVGYKDGFSKGVASVPQPSEDGTYTKEEMERYGKAKADEAVAALPADTTPISQEAYDALKSELELVKKEMAQVQSDDKADKAHIKYANTRIDNAMKALQAKMDEAASGSEPVPADKEDESVQPELPEGGVGSGTPAEPVQSGDLKDPAPTGPHGEENGEVSLGDNSELPAGQESSKGIRVDEPVVR